MSFNKLFYDTCETKEHVVSSMGPGLYKLQTPYNAGCDACFETNPHIRLQQRGIRDDRGLTDVESNLFRIVDTGSRCPSQKFQFNDPKPAIQTSTSECTFRTEECRLENPPSTLRETGFDRWQYLPRNPQDKVIIPFEWNIPYRIVAKDNHRPLIRDPIDDSSARPFALEDACEVIRKPVCAASTVDLHRRTSTGLSTLS